MRLIMSLSRLGYRFITNLKPTGKLIKRYYSATASNINAIKVDDNTLEVDNVRPPDVEITYGTMSSPLDDYIMPLEDTKITEALNSLPEVEKKDLKLLQLKIEELQSLGHIVPHMTDARWLYIIKNVDYTRFNSVKTYLAHLHEMDIKRRTDARRKVKRRDRWTDEFTTSRRQERKADLKCPVVPIAHYEKKQVQVRQKQCNLLHSYFHGQRMVWDCSWDHVMHAGRLKSLANQMTHAYHELLESTDPFHVVMSDFSPDGDLAKIIGSCITYGVVDKWLATTTEQSYLELFPKEQLVYLTPDSPTKLEKFSHDDVYVIGMLVDVIDKPWTATKARREGIRTARFPLEHVNFMSGSKLLTIDGVMRIMLGLQGGASMREALSKGVPKRKRELGKYDSRRYPDKRPPKKPIWRDTRNYLNE